MKVFSLALDVAERKKAQNIREDKFKRAFAIEKDGTILVKMESAHVTKSKRMLKYYKSKGLM